MWKRLKSLCRNCREDLRLPLISVIESINFIENLCWLQCRWWTIPPFDWEATALEDWRSSRPEAIKWEFHVTKQIYSREPFMRHWVTLLKLTGPPLDRRADFVLIWDSCNLDGTETATPREWFTVFTVMIAVESYTPDRRLSRWETEWHIIWISKDRHCVAA